MKKEAHNEEELYQILRSYILEISTAKNFITNYMETSLRYIAYKLWTEEIEKVEVTTYDGRGRIVSSNFNPPKPQEEK